MIMTVTETLFISKVLEIKYIIDKNNSKLTNITLMYLIKSKCICSTFTNLKKLKDVNVHLFKIAMEYLSMPATSVPCERLFSKAGQIITEQRTRLKGERLNKLILL